MKKLIRQIKSLPFEFQQKFNSIYKQQSNYVVNAPKTQKQVTYHPNVYPELDRFFMKFANSRPIEGRVSGKSLAFVIGSQNVGKTQYINKNLVQLNKKIQSSRSLHLSQSKGIQPRSQTFQLDANKSPQYLQTQIMQSQFQSPYLYLIKKDFSKAGDLNFINFVEDLHDQMVKQIIRVMVDFDRISGKMSYSKISASNNNNKQQPQPLSNILTPQIIKDICLSTHSAQYLFIHLKDVVFAILQQKDPIKLSKQGLQILEQFNSTYLQAGKCDVQVFFSQYFHQLLDIIHQHKQFNMFSESSLLSNQKQQKKAQQSLSTENIQKTINTIQLFYSVSQRMEYQHRPEEYQYSFYKSGIETTDFLFEMTNFLTGVGTYVESVEKQYKSLQQADKEEWKNNLLMKNNHILNGNHVDSLICMTNIDNLLCFNTREPAFLNWLDHVILRTVQHGGIRHHFPIIIQMPNRKFLDELLQLGKIQGSNPVIIQIPGYIQSFLKYSNLIQLFEEKRAAKLFHTFGRNPHTWKNAIQSMAKGVDFDEIVSGQAQYQQKEKTIIQAKLNRVYTDVNCVQLLNKGLLDLEIMQVIRLFGKVNGMGRAQFTFLGTVLFKQPHFQSMLANNIFYHSYYLPYMDYSSNLPASLSCLSQIRKKLVKNNSYLGFVYWKYFIQQYRLTPRDLRYKHMHERLFIEADTWGRDHVDLQLESTYYGPMKDYSVQYMVNNKPWQFGS